MVFIIEMRFTFSYQLQLPLDFWFCRLLVNLSKLGLFLKASIILCFILSSLFSMVNPSFLQSLLLCCHYQTISEEDLAFYYRLPLDCISQSSCLFLISLLFFLDLFKHHSSTFLLYFYFMLVSLTCLSISLALSHLFRLRGIRSLASHHFLLFLASQRSLLVGLTNQFWSQWQP